MMGSRNGMPRLALRPCSTHSTTGFRVVCLSHASPVVLQALVDPILHSITFFFLVSTRLLHACPSHPHTTPAAASLNPWRCTLRPPSYMHPDFLFCYTTLARSPPAASTPRHPASTPHFSPLRPPARTLIPAAPRCPPQVHTGRVLPPTDTSVPLFPRLHRQPLRGAYGRGPPAAQVLQRLLGPRHVRAQLVQVLAGALGHRLLAERLLGTHVRRGRTASAAAHLRVRPPPTVHLVAGRIPAGGLDPRPLVRRRCPLSSAAAPLPPP